MKTREEALNYALSFAETYQDAPFRDQNWQLVRVKKSKKAFLWTYEKEGKIWLNVKVNPETRDFWRAAYDAVIPGWHQNKEHWNTIILDGTIPEKDVKQMIAESYELVTDSPTKRIYEAVKKIPKGHVATYGQVAQMAGNPKMARAVGNALHKNPDPEHIPVKGDVVALIADLHQLAQQLVPGVLLPLAQGDHHVGIVDGVSQPVDAGHRRHHDDVPPLKQGGGGAVAQALDLVVDGGVLFDEGVRVGDIGLRLIVVVVGHEVFHGVFREEGPELLTQLGCQGFVVGQHQGGPLDLFDDLGPVSYTHLTLPTN